MLKLDSINNNDSINKSNEYKIISNELIQSKDLLNNKNNLNQIKIDNLRIISNDIKENNLINLDDINFMAENSVKVGIKINKIKLLYLASYHGFKLDDFIKYADTKDNILLVVTLNDGERFSFLSMRW